MSEQKKLVLVTGMSGLIGGAVRKRLEGAYQLRALNRSEVAGVETVRADIADLEQIQPAFENVDTVVHLAAVARMGAPWEDLLQANVIGTYNVFEAARQAGVRRVVYASSGATISGWEREEPYSALSEGRYDEITGSWPMITHESPVRPAGIYGATKVWGEGVASSYACSTDLSCISLRFGWVVDRNSPQIVLGHQYLDIAFTYEDLTDLVRGAIDAPDDLKLGVFHGVSNNQWKRLDITESIRQLGYNPQDDAFAIARVNAAKASA